MHRPCRRRPTQADVAGMHPLEYAGGRLDAQRTRAVGTARDAFERAVMAQHGDARVAQ